MSNILSVVSSNALIAAALVVVVLLVTRVYRNPQLAHLLWILVLVKLVTPPLATVNVPAAWIEMPIAGSDSSAQDGQQNGAVRSEGIVQPKSMTEDTGPVDASESVEAFELIESASGQVLVTDPQSSESSSSTELAIALAVPTAEREPSASAAGGRVAVWCNPIATLGDQWLTIFGVTWLGGAFWMVFVIVRRCLRFARILAESSECETEIGSSASRMASQFGMSRCPPVRVVDVSIPPLVWSLGLRPTIVLPGELIASLDPKQRDAVIAHELAHVLRRDYLVRWIEVVVLTLFWWNPIAWFVRRKLKEAEEECCDAWVVWLRPGERRSYGQAMLRTIVFLTEGPVLPIGVGTAFGESFYKRRIKMIMKDKLNRQMSWSAFVVVALLAAMILPVAAQTGTAEPSADAPGDGGVAEFQNVEVENEANRFSSAQRKNSLLREIRAAQEAHHLDVTKLNELKSEARASQEELLKQELKSVRSQLKVEGFINSLLRLRDQQSSPGAVTWRLDPGNRAEEGKEMTWPRPAEPEPPYGVLRGKLFDGRRKPIVRQPIWIVGTQDGETVLYFDGPTGMDGSFEFAEMTIGKPFRVFIPEENGPDGTHSVPMVVPADGKLDIGIVFDEEAMEIMLLGQHAEPAQDNLRQQPGSTSGVPNFGIGSAISHNLKMELDLAESDVRSSQGSYEWVQAYYDYIVKKHQADEADQEQLTKAKASRDESHMRLTRHRAILADLRDRVSKNSVDLSSNDEFVSDGRLHPANPLELQMELKLAEYDITASQGNLERRQAYFDLSEKLYQAGKVGRVHLSSAQALRDKARFALNRHLAIYANLRSGVSENRGNSSSVDNQRMPASAEGGQ